MQRKQTGGASSVEFSLSLFVFFIIIFFPLVNLLGIAVGAGILCLFTHQIATRCSQQLTLGKALSALTTETTTLKQTGWAKFLHLTPNGGYGGNSGAALTVLTTKIGGGPQPPIHIISAATVVPAPNSSKYIYEYSVLTTYIIKPLIPMNGVPFINQIPGLSKNVEVEWTAARAVEYVDGLAHNGGTGGNASGAPQLDTIAGADPTGGFPPGNGNSPGGWRNPGIFTSIPGNLTIVDYDSFLVPSNSYDWVSEPAFTVTSSSQQIYMDSHEEGSWTGGQIGQGAASGAPPMVNYGSYTWTSGQCAMGAVPPGNGPPGNVNWLAPFDPHFDGRVFALWNPPGAPYVPLTPPLPASFLPTVMGVNTPYIAAGTALLPTWPGGLTIPAGTAPGIAGEPNPMLAYPPNWTQIIALLGPGPNVKSNINGNPPDETNTSLPELLPPNPPVATVPPAIPNFSNAIGPWDPLQYPNMPAKGSGFINLANVVGGPGGMNAFLGPVPNGHTGLVKCLCNDGFRPDNTGSQCIFWMILQ